MFPRYEWLAPRTVNQGTFDRDLSLKETVSRDLYPHLCSLNYTPTLCPWLTSCRFFEYGFEFAKTLIFYSEVSWTPRMQYHFLTLKLPSNIFKTLKLYENRFLTMNHEKQCKRFHETASLYWSKKIWQKLQKTLVWLHSVNETAKLGSAVSLTLRSFFAKISAKSKLYAKIL